ncbi:hypothetical protein ASU35_08655 [Acetivibrio ethanolgignens]|uniref:DUF2304 domain-containing protein n=2 Tax=Acetivibrio ethanolgignens TaxID=290052 RepID=A0A0V8QGD8_9FIRM|nr:hypothetical protein ASU35_08655 [Acetivibrio ethanolgignens]
MCYGLIMKTKKKEMSESQALLWVIGAVGLLTLSCFPDIIPWVADLLEVWWPPAILIFFLLIVIILIVFHHTLSITALEAKQMELAMHIALLEENNQELWEELAYLKEEERKKG